MHKLLAQVLNLKEVPSSRRPFLWLIKSFYLFHYQSPPSASRNFLFWEAWNGSGQHLPSESFILSFGRVECKSQRLLTPHIASLSLFQIHCHPDPQLAHSYFCKIQTVLELSWHISPVKFVLECSIHISCWAGCNSFPGQWLPFSAVSVLFIFIAPLPLLRVITFTLFIMIFAVPLKKGKNPRPDASLECLCLGVAQSSCVRVHPMAVCFLFIKSLWVVKTF